MNMTVLMQLIQRWLPIILSLLSGTYAAAAQTQASTLRQVAPALSADSGITVPATGSPTPAVLCWVVSGLSALAGGVINKPNGGGSSVQDATKGILELLVTLISQGQLDDYSVKKLADMEAAKASVLLDVAQHEIQRRQAPPPTIPIRPTP